MNLAQLSPAGWCVVGLAVFFVISINVWLIALLRHGKTPESTHRSANMRLKDTLTTLHNPYAVENDRLKELSQKVEQFKQPEHEQR
jgi:cbb3-type cytochrome oxidase subunit 3